MRLGLLVLPVVAVVACTGMSPTTVTELSSSYRPSYVRYAAGLGPLPAAIQNSPFGAGSETAVAEVLGRSAPASMGEMRFVPSQAPAPYRVVLAFNPATRAGPQALCDDPSAAGAAPAAGNLHAAAVLCSSREWLTATYASGPPASDPRDPAFRAFATGLLGELLSPRVQSSDKCAPGDC